MLRILDQFVVALLLTLAATLLVVWFRSYSVGDRYTWVEVTEEGSAGISARVGELTTGEGGLGYSTSERRTHDEDSAERVRQRMERWRFVPRGYATFEDPQYPLRAGDAPPLLGALGLQYFTESRSYGSIEIARTAVVIPLWLPIAILSAYPLARYFRGVLDRERAQLRMLGLCPRCSTDVRQAPQRCPGCGKRNPLGLISPPAADSTSSAGIRPVPGRIA